MPTRFVRLGVLLVFIVGCADGFSLTDLAPPDVPTHAISDGTFGGTAGFHFLPPLVKKPAYAGTFDPGHQPVVEVLCVSAGCSAEVHAAFDQDGPAGSSTVRSEAGDEHYMVNWHSGATGALAGRTYRLRVRIHDFELGFVDVAVVRTGRDALVARANGLVAIVAGQTVPVRFRIEEEVVSDLVVTPAEATVEVGETQQFSATFLNLHGQAVAGPAVTWSSSDQDIATVWPGGLATGAGAGVAEITATGGGLTGKAALTVEATEPAGDFLIPGDTEAVATLDGWSVRCLAWTDRLCTRAQVMTDCGTCGTYAECGKWHDLTTANNGLQQRTTVAFCAIAAGSTAVATGVGNGVAQGPRSCGRNNTADPVCTATSATFHPAGFGIDPGWGLLLDDIVCDWDFDPLLTIECAAW